MAFMHHFSGWGRLGTVVATLAVFAGGVAVSYAGSRLKSIPLAELPKLADAQVLARVTKVQQMTGNKNTDKDTDEVSLTVVSVLQGNAQTGALTLIVYTRGQGSNPPLKPGDTGVFFIKTPSPEMASPRRVLPAYPGSYALFPAPQQFKVPEPNSPMP